LIATAQPLRLCPSRLIAHPTHKPSSAKASLHRHLGKLADRDSTGWCDLSSRKIIVGLDLPAQRRLGCCTETMP